VRRYNDKKVVGVFVRFSCAASAVVFKPAKHGVLLISPLLKLLGTAFHLELLILFMVEVEVAAPIMKSGKVAVLL
jgi:glyceraldehyde-3-phosphate dehydrogenase (NADP+)